MTPYDNQLLKNMNVLLVEDNHVVVENLLAYFKGIFNAVIVAQNGEDGYSRYLEHSPHVILVDIEMPLLDGLSMVKRIRNHDTDTVIFMMSAYASEHYFLDAIPLHLEGFLIKPLSSKKIDTFLDRCYQLCKEVQKKSFAFSDCLYFYSNKTLMCHGESILLTHLEIVILETLIERVNELVTFEALEVELLRMGSFSKSSLRTLITRLRQKIPSISIQNYSGRGYMLKC